MGREQPAAEAMTREMQPMEMRNIFEDPLFKRATEIFGARPGEAPLD
jgi:hypothetical protein